jgi:hypothetical protein
MIKTISVTQQDIDAGEPCHSGNCPVARAIIGVIDTHYDVMVGLDLIWFSYKNHTAKVCPLMETPTKVAKFIENFDGNNTVKPFTFELDIPDHILRAA